MTEPRMTHESIREKADKIIRTLTEPHSQGSFDLMSGYVERILLGVRTEGEKSLWKSAELKALIEAGNLLHDFCEVNHGQGNVCPWSKALAAVERVREGGMNES